MNILKYMFYIFKKMELEFSDIINSYKLQHGFAIAVSGGIDSMVLLDLIVQYIRRNGKLKPTVLTVNHNLRPEAKKEASFVLRHAKQLSIPCYILNWKTKEKIKNNVQSHARKARYELLTRWCKQNQIKYLLTAHNLNDQAETFLIKLERGSGIDGLSAINKRIIFNDVYIFRPLLTFSRKVLMEYALSRDIEWIEDPSNQSDKYKRTIYRNFIKTSSNPEVLIKRICLTSMHIRRALAALIHYTKIAFDQCTTISALGYIEIRMTDFYQLPEEIATRILVYSLMAIGSKHYKPRYSSFNNIFNRIWKRNYEKSQTLNGCIILKTESSILIIREAAKIIDKEIDLKQNEVTEYKWDNRFLCTIGNTQYNHVVITTAFKIHSQLPEYLKIYHHKITRSLPVLSKSEKILAYPHINNDNSNNPIFSISSHLVKENIINYMNNTDVEIFT